MQSPALIVCEKSGRWADFLRIALARPMPGIRLRVGDVRETRSLDECAESVEASPESVVMVEARQSNLATLPTWIVNLCRRFPGALVIAVADRDLAAIRPLLREAGAAHVVFSPRMLRPPLRMADRHLAAVGHTESNGLSEIFASLPWAE